MKIEALIAEKNWSDPDYVYIVYEIFDFIIEYNKKHKVNKEIFNGIHFDIEVNSIKYFFEKSEKEKEKIFVNYLKMIDRVVKKKNKNMKILGDEFSITFDTPFSYIGNKKILQVEYGGEVGDVFVHMDEILNNTTNANIVIMAYRRNFYGKNGSFYLIKKFLDYFKNNKSNVGFYLGFETSKTVEDTITFFGYNKSDLINELKKASEKLKSNNNFKGISIHHIDSFLNLK